MIVFKEFRFEAAHYLTGVPEGHQCANMHGHSYRVIVGLAGSVNPKTGFVLDFAEIKREVKPLIDQLDHSVLNDHAGLENPTCENLARWLYAGIYRLPFLDYVEVWETATAGCRYQP